MATGVRTGFRCQATPKPVRGAHEGPPPRSAPRPWRSGAAARRPGLEHSGRNKQHEPPPPGLDHPGTSGGLKPGTGSSGADRTAAAAAAKRLRPWRSSEAAKRRSPWGSREALDWIIRGTTRGSGQNTTTATSGATSPDARDWIIWGGTSSRSRRPPDWINRDKWRLTPRTGKSGADQAAGAATPRTGSSRDKSGRRPRLDHPGQNTKERPQPPGQEHLWRRGQKPWAGSSGADQARGATNPRTGTDAAQRTTPWRSSDSGLRTW